MATKRGSKEDRLAKVRKKLASTPIRGGGRDYWKPKVGRNVIRILPGVGDMEEADAFWQDVGQHWISRKMFFCPRFTAEEDCPICEFVDGLYKAGDSASKDLAGDIGRKKSFWLNIIDRKDEDKGVQLFTPGPTIFEAIAGMVMDPDYGEIYDIDEGMDIVIQRTGTGVDTRYEVRARPKVTPLHDDPDVVDKWLDAAYDLTPLELGDDPEEDAESIKEYGAVVYLLPHDRLLSEFEGLDVAVEPDLDAEVPFGDDDDDFEEEDDEVDDVRAAIQRKRSSRRSRRSRK